jgi:hypothetical protein
MKFYTANNLPQSFPLEVLPQRLYNFAPGQAETLFLKHRVHDLLFSFFERSLRNSKRAGTAVSRSAAFVEFLGKPFTLPLRLLNISCTQVEEYEKYLRESLHRQPASVKLILKDIWSAFEWLTMRYEPAKMADGEFMALKRTFDMTCS